MSEFKTGHLFSHQLRKGMEIVARNHYVTRRGPNYYHVVGVVSYKPGANWAGCYVVTLGFPGLKGGSDNDDATLALRVHRSHLWEVVLKGETGAVSGP